MLAYASEFSTTFIYFRGNPGETGSWLLTNRALSKEVCWVTLAEALFLNIFRSLARKSHFFYYKCITSSFKRSLNNSINLRSIKWNCRSLKYLHMQMSKPIWRVKPRVSIYMNVVGKCLILDIRIFSLAAGGREGSTTDMSVNSILLGVQALCRLEIRKNGLEYYWRANWTVANHSTFLLL